MNKIFNPIFWQKIFLPFARFSLALIYIWFGLLKVIGLSPAGPLVEHLHAATISFIPFHEFYIAFSLFEVAIGVLLLFPRLTRLAASLFALHMITTSLPLIALPGSVWTAPFAPTLEGQYIVKNLALITCVIGLLAYSPRPALDAKQTA